MTVHGVLIGQWAALVGGVIGIPVLIRRLPEPPPVELPEAGSEHETELDRMLREEGPGETYLDMAARVRRGWWSWWPVALLAGLAGEVHPVRLAWLSIGLVPVYALLAVVDWRRRLLPRVVVRPLTLVLIAFALIDWTVQSDTQMLVRELSGGVLAWAIFGLLWFSRKAGMGLGDVRLALPLGILTAAVSWNAWLIGLYVGFVGFAVFGIGLMLLKRDRRILKRAYPFGPFMIAGAYAGMALSPHLHVIG